MKTVKIDIMAGFLGAGKTTLINLFLQNAYLGERLALLENEFGEIGIDGDVLSGHNLVVKELANGCICCTLQGNFIAGILELVATHAPDRIVIEPTGVARLSDTVAACEAAAKEAPVAVNAVITVVDATMFPVMMEVGGEFYRQQIREGPVIVLSAVQNLEEDMPLESILAGLAALNPAAPVFSVPWDRLETLHLLQVAEEQTLGMKAGAAAERGVHRGEHRHGREGYVSHSFYDAGCWNEEEIRDFCRRLAAGDFGEIIRGKGFLGDGAIFRKVDYVCGRAAVAAASYPGPGKFVLIGTAIDTEALSRFLRARPRNCEPEKI